MKKSTKSKRICQVFLIRHRRFPSMSRWFFRVRRRENNEIICQSEGYSRKIDCIATAKLVTGGRLKINVIK